MKNQKLTIYGFFGVSIFTIVLKNGFKISSFMSSEEYSKLKTVLNNF